MLIKKWFIERIMSFVSVKVVTACVLRTIYKGQVALVQRYHRSHSSPDIEKLKQSGVTLILPVTD